MRGVDICAEPIARTKAGLVRGICKRSEHNNLFVSFLGVPYGGQPVGDHRFKVCNTKYNKNLKSVSVRTGVKFICRYLNASIKVITIIL